MHRTAAMIALAIGAVGLAGCASSGPRYAAASPAPPAQAAPRHASGALAAAPSADDYTSPVRIVAGAMTTTVYLRRTEEQGGDCQLFVSVSRGGYWGEFYRVVDAAGRRYPVKLLGQHMSCTGSECSYQEALRITLSNEELARAAQDGLALRLLGLKVSYRLTLPPTYVAQFSNGFRDAEVARAARAETRPVPAAPAP